MKAELKRQPDLKNGKNTKKQGFFDLGIAFAQFSAKADEENYSRICDLAASLALALPEHDRLKDQVWWDFAPPPDWFEGLDGEPFKNYYQMGMLSYLRFLLALPPRPNTRLEQIDASVQQLTDLFKVEGVPKGILDKYLTVLNIGDADEANAALREFVLSIHKTIDVNREDRLKLNDLKSAPSCFDRDIVDAIEHMLKEASVCYENECYRAAIMLCGNVVETLIKSVYKPVTENEIYTVNKKGEQIERTFKQMCDHLCADKSEFFDKRKRETLDLIYGYRSGAIHEAFWKPGKDKAYVIGRLTNDFMNDLFTYLDKHPLDCK